MGCFQSKPEVPDLHPSMYRVSNVDENEFELCTGQIKITETDIVLYRDGRGTTVWPLHSLRRYGFEGELFSFESGRRCDTGEGIYAFRCRRAASLFRALQQQIQLRNIVQESVPYPVAGLSPLPHSRQTLQASVIHRSSVDNGQPDSLGIVLNNSHTHMHSAVMRTGNQSPRSPSSADILEVTPLYPQSRTSSNHVTNIYQLREAKREHNNNQSETVAEIRHEYTNDLTRDLAILRHTLKRETAINTMRDMEYETRFLKNKLINESNSNKVESPISPTQSASSEHYAQLTIENQEGPRLYVNIVSTEATSQDTNKAEPVPTTPLTPKPVDYCNLASSSKCTESNTYANLMLSSDKVDSVKSMLLNSSEQNQKFSESDTLTSMSPVEELEVNYAVLDIDSNKEGPKANADISSPENLSLISLKNESSTSCTSQSRGRLVSQNSIEKIPVTTSAPATTPSVSIGYTTIDFDKTVALTSVAAFTDAILDGPRKTRHNSSSIICGSPISAEKSRIN